MKASTLSKISLAFVACVGLACAPGVAFAQRGGGGHGGGGGSHGGGGGGGFHGGGGGGGFHGGGGGVRSNGSFGGGGAAAAEVGAAADRSRGGSFSGPRGGSFGGPGGGARGGSFGARGGSRGMGPSSSGRDLAAGQRTGDLGAALADRRVRVLRSLTVSGIHSVGAAETPRRRCRRGAVGSRIEFRTRISELRKFVARRSTFRGSRWRVAFIWRSRQWRRGRDARQPRR